MVLPAEQFVIVAYMVLPMLSVVFLYIADICQPKYPQTDPRPMRVFYYTLPAGFAFFALFVLPFYFPELRVLSPFKEASGLIVSLRSLMGLEMGYESSIALCLNFIVLFLPGAVAYMNYSSENFSVIHGVARMPISAAEFIGFFLPPVIFIAAISGLVAGKISTSRVAGGFVHAVILSAVSLIAIWITGIVSVQLFKLPSVS
jgi:hypothetical protein